MLLICCFLAIAVYLIYQLSWITLYPSSEFYIHRRQIHPWVAQTSLSIEMTGSHSQIFNWNHVYPVLLVPQLCDYIFWWNHQMWHQPHRFTVVNWFSVWIFPPPFRDQANLFTLQLSFGTQDGQTWSCANPLADGWLSHDPNHKECTFFEILLLVYPLRGSRFYGLEEGFMTASYCFRAWFFQSCQCCVQPVFVVLLLSNSHFDDKRGKALTWWSVRTFSNTECA